MREEILYYANKYLKIDKDRASYMLDRCESTKNIDDPEFSIDISECIPISIFDEEELWKLSERDFNDFIFTFFGELDTDGLFGYCISIQGKLLIGKYLYHYNIKEI